MVTFEMLVVVVTSTFSSDGAIKVKLDLNCGARIEMNCSVGTFPLIPLCLLCSICVHLFSKEAPYIYCPYSGARSFDSKCTQTKESLSIPDSHWNSHCVTNPVNWRVEIIFSSRHLTSALKLLMKNWFSAILVAKSPKIAFVIWIANLSEAVPLFWHKTLARVLFTPFDFSHNIFFFFFQKHWNATSSHNGARVFVSTL